MRSRHFDSMILMGPFQLEAFYDSMIDNVLHLMVEELHWSSSGTSLTQNLMAKTRQRQPSWGTEEYDKGEVSWKITRAKTGRFPHYNRNSLRQQKIPLLLAKNTPLPLFPYMHAPLLHDHFSTQAKSWPTSYILLSNSSQSSRNLMQSPKKNNPFFKLLHDSNVL